MKTNKSNLEFKLSKYFQIIIFYIIFALYNILWIIFLPLIFIFFLINPYLNFDILKRFGFYKFKIQKKCLVHGSSSGEVKISFDLFKNRANYTTFNKDGYLFLKKQKIKPVPLVFDNIVSTYIFLKRNKIENIYFIEQEIWPSLILAAKFLNIKIYILNGIIYKRSFKSMKFVKFFYSYLFSRFDIIFVRDKKQKELFSIFVDEEKLKICGNLKLNINKNELIRDFKEKSKILSFFSKPILLFASIHQQEYKFIKKIIDNLKDSYFFMLVPRKINESLLLKSMLQNNHKVCLFSEVSNNLKNEIEENELIKLVYKTYKTYNIIIVDKIGILKKLYAFAYISYIGGSFIKKGGQNFIESLVKYTPAIVGDYIYNFEDLFNQFKNKGVIKINKDNLISFLQDKNMIKKSYNYLPQAINILKNSSSLRVSLNNFLNCE